MGQEAEKIEKGFMIIKDSYGKNVLNLVLTSGYLSKLLDNARIVRFLSKNYSGILSEFQNITETASMKNQ